ncbi:toprim domain-containing protein [Emticicia sp. W12TSBA100-4]|uniref:toprim domain-containing protein n=1 Tax=Emticicia sp. W12TSBA100-4 TaxID=3160965 RepID=UPI003305F756
MNLEAVKNISMQAYLQSIGFEPKNQSGNRLFYHSPFRPAETTPSFAVRPKQNDFIDFATGKGGDIIKFVERYHNVDFKEAVQLLQSFDGMVKPESFSFVCHQETKQPFQLKKVKALDNRALLEYLTERKVNLSIAKIYLKEAYYNTKEFALAFENDLGGFELRNKIRKFGTSPKTITSIKGKSKVAVLVFEGFMDFLSYLTIKNIETPEFDTIVLNSTKNLHLANDLLSNYAKIFCVLDTDKTGKKAFLEIFGNCQKSKVIDCSVRYARFGDLNEWLMKNN